MKWEKVSLGDVVTFRGGGTPRKDVQEFWSNDIPWATVKDFRGLSLSCAQDSISRKGLESSSANLIPAGHVIIPTRMALGKAAINTIEIAINQDLRALIPKLPLEPKYLLHSILGLADVIVQNGSGATVKGITQEKLAKLEIQLPPIAEQKRIAKILDAAETLRAKRREALAQLDTFVQSTFLDMFGDPVTNPKNFPVEQLSDFYIDSKNGTKCGPFGSALKKDEIVGSGIPVWNMDNIDSSGRMVMPFRMWITDNKFRELEAYGVTDGDVLISRAGTVGKMCVAAHFKSSKSIISTNLIRVRFGPNLLPIFFVSLMTYCKGRVGRLKTGPDGAFTHMSTGVLDKLKFPYPPLPLQHHFASIVESIERQKARLRAHLAELDTLFASLQHRAFNGEL
ncbi:type I restriction enzyme, S subunit [Desulfonatronum zhilinae]|nr:type I restriction enzyme, S subunit [Desulfonatronum zhilinae]